MWHIAPTITLHEVHHHRNLRWTWGTMASKCTAQRRMLKSFINETCRPPSVLRVPMRFQTRSVTLLSHWTTWSALSWKTKQNQKQNNIPLVLFYCFLFLLDNKDNKKPKFPSLPIFPFKINNSLAHVVLFFSCFYKWNVYRLLKTKKGHTLQHTHMSKNKSYM